MDIFFNRFPNAKKHPSFSGDARDAIRVSNRRPARQLGAFEEACLRLDWRSMEVSLVEFGTPNKERNFDVESPKI